MMENITEKKMTFNTYAISKPIHEKLSSSFLQRLN